MKNTTNTLVRALDLLQWLGFLCVTASGQGVWMGPKCQPSFPPDQGAPTALAASVLLRVCMG